MQAWGNIRVYEAIFEHGCLQTRNMSEDKALGTLTFGGQEERAPRPQEGTGTKGSWEWLLRTFLGQVWWKHRGHEGRYEGSSIHSSPEGLRWGSGVGSWIGQVQEEARDMMAEGGASRLPVDR